MGGWRSRVARMAVVSLLAAGAMSGCVLAEGDQYVAQPYLVTAGLHVTLKVGPTDLLHWASDSIKAGDDIDAIVRSRGGLDVPCDEYEATRYLGDRCAYRLLRATKVSGSLQSAYWTEVTSWDEFDDFRTDSMAKTRPRGEHDPLYRSCIHVTFTYIEPMSINWTWRPASDPHC